MPGGASLSRREVDAFAEVAKTYRAGGLAWLVASEPARGSFLKFLSPDQIDRIKNSMNATAEDLILIVSGDNQTVYDALGAVRCAIAEKMNLIPESMFAPLWVTEFPLLEYDEKRTVCGLHIHSQARCGRYLLCLRRIRGREIERYDIVLNGTELGAEAYVFTSSIARKNVHVALFYQRTS